MPIDKVYEPQRFEPHWAEWWVSSGIFHASPSAPGPVFSLVIPPPNVTGSLHMGHMLEHTEIDVTIRWRRMMGHNTLWLPGTDHAGIATQMVVERELAKEGLDRHQLGREEFERRVWCWKEQSGGAILRQMVRTGTSCDWSRARFTLDEGLSRAVREVFVRLYEKGLIYRGEYMINWCPRCLTALSDLEVVHEESEGNLWHFRYPVNEPAGADPRHLIVATTRPETMLGDTAVAVNPKDARYASLRGKTVRLPLMDRDIPVIFDDMADPEFGTGVVKVTPAHDPNDFAAGQRHNLPLVQVIDQHGRMTPAAGRFAGLGRFEARKQVVAALDQQGLLNKVQPYTLSAGRCQRCKTIVEPLVSTQWFAKMKPLAEPAIKAVETGEIKFIPENWVKTYNEWMYNIRDWCISRQLWWGHRIPAWHCATCGKITVSREDPTQCAHCQSEDIKQDPDVLDTWFSSGLWPFSTLGWPEKTVDLATYYPTSLLITGFDILFFWVARMIMMGIECTGEVPFRQVYIHGLVRDAEKQKMSKTRGNTIDPLDVTERYGTDAVRFSLLRGAAPGTDIVTSEDRMAAARSFANKIWNAARFIFMNMEKAGVETYELATVDCCLPEANEYSITIPVEDRWIFSRLARCAELTGRAIETYRYHEAADTLYHFFWGEFCDWYVELKKLRMQQEPEVKAHLRNLLRTFEISLRLLHPVMPFLTEELWQRLVRKTDARPASIALAPYPDYDPSVIDHKSILDMDVFQDIVTAARNLRADLGEADPKKTLDGVLYSRSLGFEIASREKSFIEKLASVQLELRQEAAPKLEGAAVRSTTEFDLVLRLPAAQADAAIKRLEKEIANLEKVIANSRRQLEDETFLSRAPGKVVDQIKSKLADYETQLAKNQAALESLASK
ncbi:MAG: valine--tRNA ligase [Bryobacteraceae bacterium]|nr:valine--tRNA ligase [Bryobacteraceae bacterium]